MVRVTLKFGKKKFKNVEIKESDGLEDLQAMILSLTNVPVDRQKIIVKGKKITSDEQVSSIKNKALVTVMGSATAVAVGINSNGNNNKVVFVEDMTDAERQSALAILPPGLYNLGNTCYLNACLQCIRGVTPLTEELVNKFVSVENEKQSQTPNMSQSEISVEQNKLSYQLGRLMHNLQSSSESVVPQEFVQYFRSIFPQFATRAPPSQGGQWQQQDADEAYTEIISRIRQETSVRSQNQNQNQSQSSQNQVSVINRVFQGRFETVRKCQVPGEEEVRDVENFIKLQCFIDKSTGHINDGISKGLSSEMTLRSNITGDNELWQQQKQISELPSFLCIQLVRFFWKAKVQKNSKILKRVVFPEKLDVLSFCTEPLRKSIEDHRKFKIQKEDFLRNNKSSSDTNENQNSNSNQNANENQAATNESETESKEMDIDVINQGLNANSESGFYELVGLVTHKGRSANSGHYIGYSKSDKRGWCKFDDENVEKIPDEEIKKLYGGGDWQMAFICFYRKLQ